MIDLQPKQAFDLITTLQDVIVIDVRTFEEFAFEHIENAINLDYYFPDFYSRIGNLDKSFIYLLYCQNGSRSTSASQYLANLGFEGIHNLNGGIIEWLVEELPLTK